MPLSISSVRAARCWSWTAASTWLRLARFVDEVLRGSPNLLILATARQSLGVAGETAWRVPSLGLAWPARPGAGASVMRFEAPRLFVERASSALPGFTLTDENASTVASLCFQLDGIPLAIELAAARIKALALDEIEARLHDRLRLLTGGSRTALLRHQTLRGTLDWSYEQLSDPERVLFRRLAVFAGGWGPGRRRVRVPRRRHRCRQHLRSPRPARR
jgi:predicted ATPase